MQKISNLAIFQGACAAFLFGLAIFCVANGAGAPAFINLALSGLNIWLAYDSQQRYTKLLAIKNVP